MARWDVDCWESCDADGRLTAECACYVWPVSATYGVPWCPYCRTPINRNMRPGWETARPLTERGTE